ncbi:MAG: tRNA lysidine(34) synthetase TilS [Rhodobacterales bacterium]|nr:MAG: tRNA lysidine(34) synthetase TilS [Rhodobacterales bacterium]
MESVARDSLWSDLSRLGVAVSGGSDSVALLHLLAPLARERGVALSVATVDHGLRPEAAAEAAAVARQAAALGLDHTILRWDGAHHGNMQAEARRARYWLLGEWAVRRRLDAVALGHTRDDLAETFLMRLGRRAGVDGLAAMAPVFTRDGARFWRPLLHCGRAQLQQILREAGLNWAEDPSNRDARFDRVRVRNALKNLGEFGLGAEVLADVSRHLARASHALDEHAAQAARALFETRAGSLTAPRDGFLIEPQETRRRLLSHAIRWLTGAEYAPRGEALGLALEAVRDGRRHTLAGVLIETRSEQLWLHREVAALAGLEAAPGALWDGRWRLQGPPGAVVRALGEGVARCPDWRETGLPRAALQASPALWLDDELHAAPLAGLSAGVSADFTPPTADFISFILSH